MVVLDLQVDAVFYSKRSLVVKNTVITIIAGRNGCTGFHGENSTVIVNAVGSVTVSRNNSIALNRKVVISGSLGIAGVIDTKLLVVVGSDMCAALNKEETCCPR